MLQAEAAEVQAHQVAQAAEVQAPPAEPPAEPVILVAQREGIKRALQVLAGVCDGARARDHQGFSMNDAEFGRSLAEQSWPLSYRQAKAGLKLVKRYRRQLSEEMLRAAGVEVAK